MVGQEANARLETAPAWGPQQTAIACYDDFVPMLLGGAQALLNGFLNRRKRDSAFVVLAIIVVVSAWLMWPILFSLRVDGTTSMPWATVWIPLWIADGIGLFFFGFLVSWGGIKAPPGWQGEWRDPYPMPMRVLALVKWCLLLLFQACCFFCLSYLRRLDRHNSWSWDNVLAPLMAWVCLRAVGELCRIFLQKKRLFMGRLIAVVKTAGEATMLFLQVLFLIWRLDGEVDWNWWVVFIPLWLLHVGQLVSWCASQALAFSLARGLDDEGATEEQRKKMIEASLLMDNAKHLRQVFGGTLVTSVLAVYLASGGDFSAFFVFFPQFLSAIWYTSAVACLVCYGNRRARQQREEMAEEEGFNTDI
ncbi:unnamed protein product [Pylaiella littoralis]